MEAARPGGGAPGGQGGGGVVIDCHCHMGYFPQFHIHEPDEGSVLARMDSLGIGIACISHHLAIGADTTRGNELSRRVCRRFPGRYKYYVVVNPNCPGRIAEQLEEYEASGDAIGFKIHPVFHGAPLDDAKYTPLYEFADANKAIILAHVWGMDMVRALDRLAGRYPGIRFIAGHAGGDFDAMERCMEVIRSHGSVYADTAVSRPWQGNIEWMAEKAGPGRILFGSDMPFYDPAHTFGRIMMADLGSGDKQGILGLNMKGLLDGRRPRPCSGR